MVQSSLNSKGFLVYENREENDFRLYAKAGELVASLKDGVQFHMSFGNEFEGSDSEIEIGATATKTKGKDSGDEQKPADPPGTEKADEESSSDDKADKKTKSRYLIVRASFNEDLLGPKLIAPVKPTVPEGVNVDQAGNVVKPAETTDGDEKSDEAEKSADDAEKTTDAADDAKPDAATTEEKKEETPNLADIYQRAIEKYRADQKKYESDVKDRAKKVEDGKKKVDELNDRFADWYYVITEEDFGKLRLSREQLVKAKEKEADGEKTDAADPAASILDSLPGTAKPAADDAAKTPAADADAAPEAANPEKKPEATTPETSPADAKPDSTAPATKDSPEAPATPAAPTESKPAVNDASPTAEKPAADNGN